MNFTNKIEVTVIEAKKDLYNGGKCFTKGKQYEVNHQLVKTEAGLMNVSVTNDQGQRHLIGGWWREFTIVTPERLTDED